jgi:hypothetical protein
LTDEETPTFELSINGARCFAIRGQLGEITTIIGTALPSLSIAEKDLGLTIIRLIRILEHLARYKMFKELVNNNVVTGELPELVSVTVGPIPKSKTFKKKPLEPVSSMQLDETEGLYDVEEKCLFRLTVRNRLDRKVHFALFNCSPEFAVEKTYPIGRPYKILTREGSSNPSTNNKLDSIVVIADEIQ